MSTEVEYPPEQTTVSLVNGILVDLQQLVEQQLQLARREIEDEIHRRSAAAAMFVLGVAVMFLDAIVLCLTLAHLLHWSTSPPGTDPSWFPLWGCHAVVATVLVVISGFILQTARSRFRSIAASEFGQREPVGVRPMDDTPEVIRHQMEETKSQLSEKLELLESQVAESIESTGIAMTATAEAVEETVQTVKGAVNDTVHSVRNALDIRRQVDRHPWLILGGCVLLGYVAVNFLTKSPKRRRHPAAIPPSPPIENDLGSVSQGHLNVAAAVEPVVTTCHVPVEESSSWRQMKEVALVALIGAVQEIASRTVPSMVDLLTGEPSNPRKSSESVHEKRSPPRRPWSPEAVRRQKVTASVRARADDSF